MKETQVRSLGQEDPLEKEMATHSSILAGESHGQRSLAGYSPFGQRGRTRLSDCAATAIQQCSLFSYFKGLENIMIQRKKFPLKEFPMYLLLPYPILNYH